MANRGWILLPISFTEMKRFSKAEVTARHPCWWPDSCICSTALEHHGTLFALFQHLLLWPGEIAAGRARPAFQKEWACLLGSSGRARQSDRLAHGGRLLCPSSTPSTPAIY